jgi:hypothetical protein
MGTFMNETKGFFYRPKKYPRALRAIVIVAIASLAATVNSAAQQSASTPQDTEKVVEKIVHARVLFGSVFHELWSQCENAKVLPQNIIAAVNEAGRNIHYAIDDLLQMKSKVKRLPEHAIGQLRQLTKLEYWDGRVFTEGGALGCTYDVDIATRRFGYALDYLGIWKKNGFE